MAAPDYDLMEEDAPAEETEDGAADDPSNDDEYMMAAEEAGFTGEKAAALWRAVARCVELTGGGDMPLPMEEEEA